VRLCSQELCELFSLRGDGSSSPLNPYIDISLADLFSSFFDFRRIGAAGRRYDAVQPEIERHLTVVIGGVPNNHGRQAQARIGAGVSPFDRLVHILRGDGAERLADRGKRVAQVDEQFLFGVSRAGTAFVAGVGRLLPIELRGKTEV
jgi:hypothetical protein